MTSDNHTNTNQDTALAHAEPEVSLPARSTTQPSDGSTLYYALLKVDSTKRDQMLDLLALCKTLAGTLHDVREVTVAEKKLHWWHEEIERLHDQSGTNTARHPATSAVTALVKYYAIEAESWYAILRSNNDEKFINAENNETFITRLTTDYGARISLCCQLLDDAQLPAQQDWATGLGLFDRLSRFRHLHGLGYPVLPDSDYAAVGIEPAQIYEPTKQNQVQRLFKPRINDARNHLQIAVKSLEQSDNFTAAMLPFLTLGRLRLKQLNLWVTQDVRPSERYVTLTPLRKAWISYRTRKP